MNMHFRLKLIVILLMIFTVPIVIIESPLVRSSARLGRLVFTDTPNHDNQYTVIVSDSNDSRRRLLQREPYQEDGFLYQIDRRYAYISLCYSQSTLICTAPINQIATAEDQQRYEAAKQFWKDNYKWPVWSPDGKYIALNVLQQDTLYSAIYISDVYVMNADGTHIVDLTPNENVNVHDVVWSPDSQKIAFACGDDPQYLCLNNVEGNDLQQLGMPIRGMVGEIGWSPDGNQIVFTLTEGSNSNRSGIFLINADGTNAHRLVGAGSDEFDYSAPVWSPDSSKIAFQLRLRQGNDSEIYVVKRDGTDAYRVSGEIDGNTCCMVWSPNSQNIAYFSFSKNEETDSLYMRDIERSIRLKIANNQGYDLSYLPRILFWIP